MIILGVDPGTNYTGFGVIKQKSNSYIRVINGIIKLPANLTIPFKLEIIYDELVKIIDTYKPDEFAIETAFYGKNVQSAMKIGYARGAALLAAVHKKVPTSEYSPREIKKSVVGRGSASKEQVYYMIKTLLELKEEKMRYDESDALAVAICHAFRINRNSGSVKRNKDWKSFVETYPERVVKN
ncbi:MAG: crossover junction endodeoxyribonuclease RuvC [Ignavibacteriaceae bacterium]